MIESLRYKLRGFGIPVEGPAEVFCDNMPVVKNSSIHTSALNKRLNEICYHSVREAQDAGIIWVGWIPGEFNLADLFKNTTIPGNTRHNLVDSIFSNKTSPIGDIEKSQGHSSMVVSKYFPNYNISRGEWVLGIAYIYFIQIDHLWLSICGD